ncbi:hypothetical protein GJ496_008342 [Pomphorhynchus laevis]|nr:hypothetical protein GJ496_008342 [Pomphorhynchus laevis]
MWTPTNNAENFDTFVLPSIPPLPPPGLQQGLSSTLSVSSHNGSEESVLSGWSDSWKSSGESSDNSSVVSASKIALPPPTPLLLGDHIHFTSEYQQQSQRIVLPPPSGYSAVTSSVIATGKTSFNIPNFSRSFDALQPNIANQDCISEGNSDHIFHYQLMPSCAMNDSVCCKDNLENNNYDQDVMVKEMIKGLQQEFDSATFPNNFSANKNEHQRVSCNSTIPPKPFTDTTADVNSKDVDFIPPFLSCDQRRAICSSAASSAATSMNAFTTDNDRGKTMTKNNQHFHQYISRLDECVLKNRIAAHQLVRKHSDISTQIEQCFNQLHDNINSRKNQLHEKLATVYKMKLNSLNGQLNQMSRFADELKRNVLTNDIINSKLELCTVPSDNDEIALNCDDIWQLQRSIERFAYITTNACASMSYICPESIHPRQQQTQYSHPFPPFCSTIVNTSLKLEVQTKNYLGILLTTGGDLVQASVIQSTGETYSASVIDRRNGRYIISTIFFNPGRYLMTISVNGKMIKDVPLQIYVRSVNNIATATAPIAALKNKSLPPVYTQTVTMQHRPYTRKFTVQYKPGIMEEKFASAKHATIAGNLGGQLLPHQQHPYAIKSSDGSTISEYSMFCRPWGICIDSENNIYVADRSNNHIKIMNMYGTIVLTLGCYGKSDDGKFDRPSSVAFDNNKERLIVCDKDNHRIQIYKIDPKNIKRICQNEPDGTTTDNNIVVDGNHSNECDNVETATNFTDDKMLLSSRGEKYFRSLEYKPLIVFGNRGNRPGEFHYPWDCATNSKSEIFITDTRNHRIQMFTCNGMFMRKFGYDGILWKRLDSPRGIAVSKDDKIVATDFNNHRIIVLDSNLTNEYYISDEGEEPGKLKRPQGVAFDNNGNILVADSRNYRIQAFSMSGVYKYHFGCLGEGGNEEMDRPTGICMDNNGTLFVVDFGNNRLVAF